MADAVPRAVELRDSEDRRPVQRRLPEQARRTARRQLGRPGLVRPQSLGRAPAGNVPNVTINMLAPGEMYGDRLNQLDFRAGKVLRFGRTRTLISADLYNALNSSAVLTYNNAFVPNGTWLQPQTVLTGRLIKFAAEITF